MSCWFVACTNNNDDNKRNTDNAFVCCVHSGWFCLECGRFCACYLLPAPYITMCDFFYTDNFIRPQSNNLTLAVITAASICWGIKNEILEIFTKIWKGVFSDTHRNVSIYVFLRHRYQIHLTHVYNRLKISCRCFDQHYSEKYYYVLELNELYFKVNEVKRLALG
jgi:hypothetical protein